MQSQPERRDDAEVAAAAAECPVQVGVRALVGGDDGAVREDDLGAEDVVDREAGLPRQVPDAAAEHQAARAGRRDDPAGRREAVRVCGGVDLSEQAAAVDRRGARVGVDIDLLEAGEVDQDPIVDAAEAGAVVAAAADGELETALAAEVDRGGDVVHGRGADDEYRALVDHRVEQRPVVVVGGVARANHGARTRAASVSTSVPLRAVWVTLPASFRCFSRL
jgi:hypothetical protein